MNTYNKSQEMIEIENAAERSIDLLKISGEQQELLEPFLSLIKIKHLPTFYHSLRVAELARNIGKMKGLDQKALWYSGSMHDIGKTLVDRSILDKTRGFGESDMNYMRNHVTYGYLLLKDFFPFSSEIALRHHLFQRDPYPSELPPINSRFSPATMQLISECSRNVALADYYDSAKNRVDKVSGKYKSSDEVRLLLLSENPDQQSLIERLYDEKIFN